MGDLGPIWISAGGGGLGSRGEFGARDMVVVSSRLEWVGGLLTLVFVGRARGCLLRRDGRLWLTISIVDAESTTRQRDAGVMFG